MSKSKKKVSGSSLTTLAPNPTYAPQINEAETAGAQGWKAAEANNATLMPRINNVLDYNQRTMGGEFLGGNPHLQGMIDRSTRDISDSVNSNFSLAGRYGSGAHQGVLARALGDMQNQYRFQNYATERGLQDAAGGKLLQGATISAAMPQMASSTYADQVAQLLGRYTNTNETGTTKTRTKEGLLGSLLQAGAQAAGSAIAASDRRLKRGIEKIGELEDGLGVYAWRYIWGTPGVGVMADEVEKLRPWALGPEMHGFATVDYGRL